MSSGLNARNAVSMFIRSKYHLALNGVLPLGSAWEKRDGRLYGVIAKYH
jgi:hypothetical protein